MIRIYLFMTLLASCFFAQVFANDLVFRPKDKSFLKYWSTSNRLEQSRGKEKASVQVFERYVRYKGTSYSVGSMTYLEFPKHGEFSQREIIEGLKTGYDISSWKTKRSKNELIVEGEWKEGSRVVRLAIKEEEKRYIAVTTLYRRGYQEPLAIESFILERKLLGSEVKTVFLPEIISDLFISSAHANPLSGIGASPAEFLNIGSILDSISPSDIIPSGGVSGITGGGFNVDVGGNVNVDGNINIDATRTVDAIDRSVAGTIDRVDTITGDRIDQVDNAVGDRITQVDGVINNSLDRVDGQLDRGLDQVNETTRVVDRNWSETNRQAARANDVAAKLADPKHMFLLAGATAAGTVVGGFVTNMAIQGLMTGIDWMIEQMTGKKASAERWRQFQEARRQWDKTLDNARKLENSIDQFILFHETLATLKERLPASEREKLSMDKILELFGREILLKEKRRKELYDLFMKADAAACEQVFATQLTQMDSVISNMNQVLQVLQNHKSANPNVDIFDERYFCSQMDNMMRNLVDAESALQRYRLHLINGQAEWKEELTKEVGNLQGVTKRLSSDGDAIMDKEVRAARELYEKNYNALRDRLKKECRDSGLMFTGGCVDDKMKGSNASELANIAQRRDEAIKRASGDATRRTGRPVTVNDNIEYDRLRSHQDWFEELEDQQFCSKNPDDERCLKLAEFGYNGVFYVKERGYNKLDEMCSDQRMTLDKVEEGMRQDALQRAPASSSDGIPPSQVTKDNKGFFSSLFGAVGNFFRSIGEFFGFVGPKKTVGELRPIENTLETIRPEENIAISDSSRIPASVEESFYSSKPIIEINKNAGPEKTVTDLEGNAPFVEVLSKSGLSRDNTVSLTKDISEIINSESYDQEQINYFLEKLRDDEEYKIVVQNIFYKYSNNKGLRQFLLMNSLTELSDEEDIDRTAQELQTKVEIEFNFELNKDLEQDGISVEGGTLVIDPSVINEEKRDIEFYQLLSELKNSPHSATFSHQELKAFLERMIN